MLYVNPLAESGAGHVDPSKLEGAKRQTALQEMEHFFANMMLREMHKSMPKDTLFGGHEMETYQEMMDDALSGEMAKSGSLGIAKMLDQQLRIESMQQDLHAQMMGGSISATASGPNASRIDSYVPITSIGYETDQTNRL